MLLSQVLYNVCTIFSSIGALVILIFGGLSGGYHFVFFSANEANRAYLG